MSSQLFFRDLADSGPYNRVCKVQAADRRTQKGTNSGDE